MKIVHLADTHLGYLALPGVQDPDEGINRRQADVFRTWREAVEKAIALAPAAVIHAGDLFDSSRPAPRTVTEALDGLALLRDAGIPVVVIAGNHEAPRFRSGGSIFQILERFGIHAIWREPETVRVNGLAIHAVPHEPDAQKLVAAIASLELDPKADANVLVLHAGLEALPRQRYQEVNEITLDPAVLTRLDYDYIAMGHLHAYRVPQVNAAYPGSLERLDFADAEGEKALLEVDLGAGAGVEGFLVRHPVSARPLINLTVDCHEVDAVAVLASIEKAAASCELKDAVARIVLDRIARDVYQGLDYDAVARTFTACLHHSVQLGRGGLVVGGESATKEVTFAEFARERIPKGVDAEAVIGLADRYLSDAAAEEAEEAAG